MVMISSTHISNRIGGAEENRAVSLCGRSHSPGWNMSGGSSCDRSEATAKRREGQVFGQGDRQETRNTECPTK
jgi:hypothetical protein